VLYSKPWVTNCHFPLCVPPINSLLLSVDHTRQKPVHRYERMVEYLQNIFDLLVGVRKVREHIPRKETVVDVLQERIEFVSMYPAGKLRNPTTLLRCLVSASLSTQ
jgi:hypothetical protein